MQDTANTNAVSVKGNTVVVDLTDCSNETGRFIESVSIHDLADVGLRHTLSRVKLELSPDLVGKTLVVIGGKQITKPQATPLDTDQVERMKELHRIVSGLPHADIITKVAELCENNSYIRDAEHLTKLLGLPHNSVGGDFETGDEETTRDGDLKFYKKGSAICLGGGVKFDTIIKQGSGLVIAWHPRDDKHHITEVSYLNIWKLVSGARDEMADLLADYDEHKGNPDRVFESERFKIVRHKEHEDRFYIKSNAVRHCSIKCFINKNYVKKTHLDHLAEQFETSKADEKLMSGKKAERGEITLGELIKFVLDKTIVLPDYQRVTIKNEKLVDQFVGDSIMNGLQGIRGEFMFHHVGDKIYLVDGQQRIYNAIYNYFIANGGTRELGLDVKPLQNGLEVAGFSWKHFNDLAETNTEIKKFRDGILNCKFSVKHYYGYSQAEMANEYTVANRSTSMTRIELRAASPSPLGKYVRFFTAPLWNCEEMRPETYTSLRQLPIKIKLFDDFFVRRRNVLKKVNITTNRMNMDDIIAKTFNWAVNYGKKTFKENEDYMDSMYESYTSDEQVAKDWEKFTELFQQITTAMAYLDAAGGYDHDFVRGDRRHRTKEKGVLIGNKEEWDMIILMILELRRLHPGKKLKITGDVISSILDFHYNMVVFNPNKSPGVANENETPYGLSVRVNQRTYSEINNKWLPNWKQFLGLNLIDLKKLGFTFE
jgi:hypothetical protein